MSDITVGSGLEEYGVSKTTYYHNMNQIIGLLRIFTIKLVNNQYTQIIERLKLHQVLATICIHSWGATHKLLLDDDTLIVVTAEMKVIASKP